MGTEWPTLAVPVASRSQQWHYGDRAYRRAPAKVRVLLARLAHEVSGDTLNAADAYCWVLVAQTYGDECRLQLIILRLIPK